MVSPLLQTNIQKFINDNLDKNVAELILKYKEIDGTSIREIAQQIQGKQKARYKLPNWYNTPNILFPSVISLEQCSSEITAQYKSEILDGDALLDLTGGLGIDTFAFAQKFKKVSYNERNTSLLEITQHNFEVLEVNNVQFYNEEANTFLAKSEKADCIYLDPARRDNANKKIFLLEECDPDIIKLLPGLLAKAKQVLIKTSPMLDIKAAIKVLGHVKEIHIVALDNECKEVLYLLTPLAILNLKIHTINFTSQNIQRFSFDLLNEEQANAEFALPLQYLYEPNAAILKSGAFNIIAKEFKVQKLHTHSHLYTSQSLIADFPGRKFKILSISKYDRVLIQKILLSSKANITARNFPDSVEKIRKKLGLAEGGEYYLFATTDLNNKLIIIITEKA